MHRRGAMALILIPILSACQTGRPAPARLQESWSEYKKRFIQGDGRVIDHAAGGITTSEGQAYAMLRAVWVGDRAAFDAAFQWAKNNLNSGVRRDRLWAWKWGKANSGEWKVLDRAFASDADQDAAVALLAAHRAWRDERYLQEARAIIQDLWKAGTKMAGEKRFLLAGDSLCQGMTCRLNPSYMAPYAYRMFAKVDRDHNWQELVDSSYWLLETASSLTRTRLPPDWILLDTSEGRLRLSNEKDSAFSYDALRTYWRVALDWEVYRATQARDYMRGTLAWAASEWNRRRSLPAVIGPSGKAMADWQSLEMLSAMISAVRQTDERAAGEMADRLSASYSRGVWGDKNSYYLQNWAWFGTALWDGYLEPLKNAK